MLALGGSSPRHRNRSCEQEKRKLVTWFRVWGFGWFRLAHSRTAGISGGLGLGIPAGDLSMLLVVRVFTSAMALDPFQTMQVLLTVNIGPLIRYYQTWGRYGVGTHSTVSDLCNTLWVTR